MKRIKNNPAGEGGSAWSFLSFSYAASRLPAVSERLRLSVRDRGLITEIVLREVGVGARDNL